jgi:prevent-host-death family protein
MAERVSAAQAKAQLSALMAAVAYGGKHFIIERRGKPLAALVSVEDLERLEQGQATFARPLGALALVGAWRDVGDEEIDALVADIYAAREKDFGRPVELED